jgi:hypothetical protein
MKQVLHVSKEVSGYTQCHHNAIESLILNPTLEIQIRLKETFDKVNAEIFDKVFEAQENCQHIREQNGKGMMNYGGGIVGKGRFQDFGFRMDCCL